MISHFSFHFHFRNENESWKMKMIFIAAMEMKEWAMGIIFSVQNGINFWFIFGITFGPGSGLGMGPQMESELIQNASPQIH